ncbi:MAG: antibiotic biosynthesis monooxygenase [Pseudomonadota bacterium]
MILTVFRSRLKSDLKPEQLQKFMQMFGRMSALAPTMPGYISHKGFGSEDGERVVIVEFETEEAQLAFASHPAHQEAIELGVQHAFLDYSVQICNVQRVATPQRAQL